MNCKSPFFGLPTLAQQYHAILDVGCGIGQTIVASRLEEGKLLIGLDIDIDSLSYGHREFDYIQFAAGTAECLPFRNGTFDLVISSVTLPYTHIPKSVSEIRRVLKNGGTFWLRLHPLTQVLRGLKDSISELHLRGALFRSYVLINGLVFHFSGKLFALPFWNRCESFQTRSRIIKTLKAAGFAIVDIRRHDAFIVTARVGA